MFSKEDAVMFSLDKYSGQTLFSSGIEGVDVKSIGGVYAQSEIPNANSSSAVSNQSKFWLDPSLIVLGGIILLVIVLAIANCIRNGKCDQEQESTQLPGFPCDRGTPAVTQVVFLDDDSNPHTTPLVFLNRNSNPLTTPLDLGSPGMIGKPRIVGGTPIDPDHLTSPLTNGRSRTIGSDSDSD